jgi:D-alanyl-D-alanine carboxypeptidase
MMKKTSLLVFFLLIALTAGPWVYAQCPRDRPEPPYDWADPDLPGRLDQVLEAWAGHFGFYGAAAVVTTPGWLDWSGSIGVKNIDTMEPYEIDTLARIGSSTKPFTSTLILQLVDEGLLTLDTTLAEFAPWYPNAENLTVELLLQHRSGMMELHFMDAIFDLYILLLPRKWHIPEEILLWTILPIPMFHIVDREFKPREPYGEPGEIFHYSQPGYCTLGMIIEKVTGKALADVYDERVFQPLGMTGSHLPRKNDPYDPWGYVRLFNLLPEKIPGPNLVRSANSMNSGGWSAGGLVSNAPGLVAFLANMLEGCLFSEEGLANATDFIEIEPSEINAKADYGLGLFRKHYEAHGFTTIGHDGSAPGHWAVMQYIPEVDVYIGAVTNSDKDAGGGTELVARVKAAVLNESP